MAATAAAAAGGAAAASGDEGYLGSPYKKQKKSSKDGRGQYQAAPTIPMQYVQTQQPGHPPQPCHPPQPGYGVPSAYCAPTAYGTPPVGYATQPGYAPPPGYPGQPPVQTNIIVQQPGLSRPTMTGVIILSCITFFCSPLFGCIAFSIAICGIMTDDNRSAKKLKKASLGISIAGLVLAVLLIIVVIVLFFTIPGFLSNIFHF